MTEALTPVEVLCCYSHRDEAWLHKLEAHLSLLKRQGFISLWHDRLIAPGIDWAKAIDTHLETASVILLLVSADFLASDYCYGVEMKRALERHAASEACVVPILVRPVDWNSAPFAHLQALPTDTKPIASWRNKDRALANVTAGLRRVIEDVSLLAASAPRAALPAIWNIPYPRNPFFLGRDNELVQLRSYLQTDQATALSQPQAVSGLGGIGKTQLALEYAYRYHQDYQAVLWARAESTEALVSSYVAIATLLRLPEHEAREQGIIVQAVKNWLQTHRGWLLILDNADQLALLPDYLPPALGGHLLMTTRAAATGRLAHRLEIETLLPEQGALLLLRRAALLTPDAELSYASQEERVLALRISEELGGLPLALDQAGAYLEETGCSLSEYLTLYQQRCSALLKRRSSVSTDYPHTVASTWALSFGQVELANPAAAELLRFCAFLAPDLIPEAIISEGAAELGLVLSPVAADPLLLNEAIQVLQRYSLVKRDPKARLLNLHRLVQIVLKDGLDEATQRQWAERTVRAVSRAFPEVSFDTWNRCEQCLQHVQACAILIDEHRFTFPEAVRLLNHAGWYLVERGLYGQAKPLLQRALTVREHVLGSEHLDTLNTVNNLAILYRYQGNYEQAESLLQRVLAVRERALGPEHPDTLRTIHSLANLYRYQGKYEQAEFLYQRALTTRERVLGPEHPDTLRTVGNLATLYRYQGNYGQAEPLLQRVLTMRECVLGPEHPYTLNTVNNLANLYRDQGKYEQAEPLYQRALTVQERVLGPEHPDTLGTIHDLANLYRDQNKYEQAEQLYQRALTTRERVLGPEHPDTVATREAYTTLLRVMHRQEPVAPRQEAISQEQ